MPAFLGQLALFPFNFAPVGWAMCQGQLLPISQNTALFSLLGTYYGGNGTTTFQLPDLQGRVALGQGAAPGLQPYTLGEIGGMQAVTLTTAQMPAHTHALEAYASLATTPTATGARLAEGNGGGGRGGFTVNSYATGGTATTLAPAQIAQAGGGLPHNTLQPYLALTWCIALQGIYPSRP